MLNQPIVFYAAICCLGLAQSSVHADERLAGIACRSVHLAYEGKDMTAFYNEVEIKESAPGTYFMVCGWDAGYFGMQELGNGKKLVLFSVWDNFKGDDPNAVDPAKRVQLIHKDPEVRVGRFGGEGTGGQSFFDYEWKTHERYQFLVSCKPNGERTEYSGFFYVPETRVWKHLITFSTITGGKRMRGFYSFVEDFKRDRKSTTMTRRALFGNVRLISDASDETAITKARFTADANPATNIDAGTQNGMFYLSTGGGTPNEAQKLKSIIELMPRKEEAPLAQEIRALIPKQ